MTSRRLPLLLLLVTLGACDYPERPDPTTNPYDPRYGDGRLPSPVTEMEFVSSGFDTVTIRWNDPSSFEREFRVFRTSFPVGGDPNWGSTSFGGVRVDADQTEVTLEATSFPSDPNDIAFRVVVVGPDGSRSVPGPDLRLTRPTRYARFTSTVQLVAAEDGEWAYTWSGSLPQVDVWDPEAGVQVGTVSGVDRFVGTLDSGEDVLVAGLASTRGGSTAGEVAVVNGTEVVRRVSVEGLPVTAAQGGVVYKVSGDGRTLVTGRSDGIERWSLETGERIDGLMDVSGGFLLAVTSDASLALFFDGGLTLADLDAGEVRWRRANLLGGILDRAGTLLLAGQDELQGRIEQLDLATGETIQRFPGYTVPAAFSLDGEAVAFGVNADLGTPFVHVMRTSDFSLIYETVLRAPRGPLFRFDPDHHIRVLDGTGTVGEYQFERVGGGASTVEVVSPSDRWTAY